MKKSKRKAAKHDFAAVALHALQRAAKTARKTAKMYGTPIYISRNGKVVAIKP